MDTCMHIVLRMYSDTTLYYGMYSGTTLYYSIYILQLHTVLQYVLRHHVHQPQVQADLHYAPTFSHFSKPAAAAANN